MIKLWLLLFLYICVALPIEVIVLPTLEGFSPYRWHPLYHWPLMALPPLIVGFLRGEVAGMIMAVLAALLVCFSQPPNNSLGSMIVSLSVAAYCAGFAARRSRLSSFGSRLLLLLGLLMLDQTLASLVRRMFWASRPLAMPWDHLPGLIMTSLLGAFALRWLAPRFKVSLAADSDRRVAPSQTLRRSR